MITPGVRPRGDRLPDETRPGAVELLVSDLARSLDYYRDVLGLTVLEAQADAAALGPSGGPALLSLRTRPSVRRASGARLGLFHFALLVPDRPSLGRFLSHLATTRVPMASADHAVSEAIYLQDPDGLGIEVYCDRPRETWRMSGDEIYMTTERLDLRGLSEAGRGREFTGLPAGTVLGHMHLHVGDLDQASAFYHDQIGFDRMVWSYPGALFLAAGGYHHHLGTNTWAGGAAPRADEEAGLLGWDLVLPTADDVAVVSRRVSAAGGTVTTEGTGAAVADPWGTRLRLRAR